MKYLYNSRNIYFYFILVIFNHILWGRESSALIINVNKVWDSGGLMLCTACSAVSRVSGGWRGGIQLLSTRLHQVRDLLPAERRLQASGHFLSLRSLLELRGSGLSRRPVCGLPFRYPSVDVAYVSRTVQRQLMHKLFSISYTRIVLMRSEPPFTQSLTITNPDTC